MPVINISDELYRKLEAMANGFDSPQNVIEKLLEKRESKESLRYPQEERCSDFSVDDIESEGR
jgi:predicted CopG family antitoxin